MEPESKKVEESSRSSNNNSSSKLSKCQACQAPADKVCAGCKLVSYCSVDHQKSDWKTHKKECQPFTIKSNDQYGRYMVATRDIEPGTVIMNEEPIIYGPKQDTLPICLGCNNLLMVTPSNYTCSKCNFPMCGPACEKIPIHADNECAIFSENRVIFLRPIEDYSQPSAVYECLLTLRCLMLKSTNAKKWAQLTAMTAQNEARKKTLPGLWYRNQMNTVKMLAGPCRFGTEFSETDIHTVIGYIDINAFEIKIGNYDVSGLFNNTYIMSHDCVSNTHHTFTEDKRMVVRASVRIPKGEQITTSYASVLDGTAQRSVELLEAKFFLCKCARCLDPTEFGTYLTALKCQRCEKGYAVPVHTLNQNSAWKCQGCSLVVHSDKVRQLMEPIFLEIKAAENESPSLVLNSVEEDTITKLEKIITKYSGKVLHPNHYLMFTCLHSLVSLYGRVPGWLVHDLTLEQLERMRNICLQMLSVLDKIEPGLSRLRGFVLYQLHAAYYYITPMEAQAKIITKAQVKERLAQMEALLRESYQILNFDGPNTPEGAIAQTIPKTIDDVARMLSQFSLSN